MFFRYFRQTMNIKEHIRIISTLSEQIYQEGLSISKSIEQYNILEVKKNLSSLSFSVEKINTELKLYNEYIETTTLLDFLFKVKDAGLISNKFVKTIRNEIKFNDKIDKLTEIKINQLIGAGKKTVEEYNKVLKMLPNSAFY